MGIEAIVNIGYPPNVRMENVLIEVKKGVATCTVSAPEICRQRAEITERRICNEVTLSGRSSDTVHVTLQGCATCGMVPQSESSQSSQV